MAFGHHEHVVENSSETADIFSYKKTGAAFATPDFQKCVSPYFVASPSSVTLMPLLKLKGSAGDPGARS